MLHFLSGAALNVVAMALSGYTEEKKTMWRDMCRSLCGQVGSKDWDGAVIRLDN